MNFTQKESTEALNMKQDQHICTQICISALNALKILTLSIK